LTCCKAPGALGFIDPACDTGFITDFSGDGRKVSGVSEVQERRLRGFSQVEVQFARGRRGVLSRRPSCSHAVGRVALATGIGLDRLQIAISRSGHVQREMKNYQDQLSRNFKADGAAIESPALACAARIKGGAPRSRHWADSRGSTPVLVVRRTEYNPGNRLSRPARSGAASKKIEVIVGRARNHARFCEKTHIEGEDTGFIDSSAIAERRGSRV